MIISIILSIITILLISRNSLYLGNKLGLVDQPSKNKIRTAFKDCGIKLLSKMSDTVNKIIEEIIPEMNIIEVVLNLFLN